MEVSLLVQSVGTHLILVVQPMRWLQKFHPSTKENQRKLWIAEEKEKDRISREKQAKEDFKREREKWVDKLGLCVCVCILLFPPPTLFLFLLFHAHTLSLSPSLSTCMFACVGTHGV